MSFLIPSGGAAAPVVTKLAGVDVDPGELERAKEACKPWFMDYENLRELPLVVELYEGSIAEVDDRFDGYDAAVCMEVIEHLDPPVLEALPHTLFGKHRRKVVVVSTPNSEFNIHFEGLLLTERGEYMRHHDHRFEWTRKQFEHWATTIAQKYDYTVRFSGVGIIGKYDPAVGHCSQIAIFEDALQLSDPPTKVESPHVSLNGNGNGNSDTPNGPYRRVSHFEFPWYNVPDLPESETIRILRGYIPFSCTALTEPETAENDRFLRLVTPRTVFRASFDSLWSVSRIRQLVRRRDVLYRHLAADPDTFTLILPRPPSETVDARNLDRISIRDYDQLIVLVHPKNGLDDFGPVEYAKANGVGHETEDDAVESDQGEEDLEDYSYRPSEGDTENDGNTTGWEGTWSDCTVPCQGGNSWDRQASGWDFPVEPN